ncbi:MAG TPA: DUF3078 domain-containing protein [Rhodothermales bacterium]|nr:DUF3078 domain-containing protein [Rhodothermales bacterium]
MNAAVPVHAMAAAPLDTVVVPIDSTTAALADTATVNAVDTAAAAVPDTATEPAWKTDMVVKLGGSQAKYQNWSKGGVSSLALTTGLDATAKHVSVNWEERHELHLAYGLIKQDTLNVQKANDEVRLRGSVQHKSNATDFFRYFNPTVAIEIRTQFAPGYNYKSNPFKDGRELPVKVSDRLSPLIMAQAIGLSYEPDKWFSQRLGVGAKQTVVADPEFRSLYGVDSARTYNMELGIESHTRFDRELFENVSLKSVLSLFGAFNKPDLPDMQWENEVTMKVNTWLGVNFEVDALYDRDFSRRVQIRELFSLGFAFTLL